MSTQRDAFDRAIVAWNAHDLDRYLELYDERIALHGYSDQPLGKAEVREYYETIFAALSNNVLEIHSVSKTVCRSAAASRCTARTPARSRASRRPVGASHNRASRSSSSKATA